MPQSRAAAIRPLPTVRRAATVGMVTSSARATSMGTFIEKTGTSKAAGSVPSQIRSPSTPKEFVNVPISELEGEYLVLRAGSVLGLRVEPLYATLDD